MANKGFYSGFDDVWMIDGVRPPGQRRMFAAKNPNQPGRLKAVAVPEDIKRSCE